MTLTETQNIFKVLTHYIAWETKHKILNLNNSSYMQS